MSSWGLRTNDQIGEVIVVADDATVYCSGGKTWGTYHGDAADKGTSLTSLGDLEEVPYKEFKEEGSGPQLSFLSTTSLHWDSPMKVTKPSKLSNKRSQKGTPATDHLPPSTVLLKGAIQTYP